MKNKDDLTNLAKELLDRKLSQAGKDMYSDIYGEVSNDELEYRKARYEEFLKDASTSDGTFDETNYIISKIDSILNSRK